MPTPRIEFNPETGSAIVEIYRPNLVDVLKYNALRDGFTEKGEFHVTLIPPTDFNEEETNNLAAVMDGEIKEIIVSQQAIYRMVKPKIVEGEIFERESIIARVYSEDLRRILGRIPIVIGRELPMPFLHVTLFTKGDNEYARRGIGIADVAEFATTEHYDFPPRI